MLRYVFAVLGILQPVWLLAQAPPDDKLSKFKEPVRRYGERTHQYPIEKFMKACDSSAPLGMISGNIKDWQITASSAYPQEWDRGCHESHARLYQKNKLAWCAKYKSSSEWLQVDLGVPSKVTGVMTQGRGDGKEWVTAFKVSYGINPYDTFEYIKDAYGNQKIFEGNTDSFKVKHSYLDKPILARYIKFHTEGWSRHPSMRVEIIGCQECNKDLGLPPYAKISASNEHSYKRGSSCLAEYGHIMSNKAWCPRWDDDKQWLQFDIGPPTLVTGITTKGREDTRKDAWVRQYRISYSNDSLSWFFYMNEADSTSKIFGGNVDKHTERTHFLSRPFVARFIRFHPVAWPNGGIAMRAGIKGCTFKGPCGIGYLRINEDTPCIENLAYRKESFISDRRPFNKRHTRLHWKHGQAARAVDGNTDTALQSCTILDNSFVENPVWKVDLGKRAFVKGMIVYTWQNKGQPESIFADYKKKLDKVVIYVDKRPGRDNIRVPDNECGHVTKENGALFQSRLHIECAHTLRGRYVFIEAWGARDRERRLFSAVLCEVEVY